MASLTENDKDTNSKIPSWLNVTQLEGVLKQNIVDYKNVKNFHLKPAVAAGENYSTNILRIGIDVELKDGTIKPVSYLIKLPTNSDVSKQMLKHYNSFAIETKMYRNILPELQQMYHDAGAENVKFGANCYTLDIEENYVLIDDLCMCGFKNINRMDGLDEEHTKCVLEKLAQWHAASATRVETKGKYEEILSRGLLTDAARPMMEHLCQFTWRILKQCLPKYNGHAEYAETLEQFQSILIDKIFQAVIVDPNEFNVLNHGDCWLNNIMFQYDTSGKVKETYFVDFQVPKYGSPAQDLIFFLISSPKLELKLKKFDYFIKIYHDKLVENLKLLQYPKSIPSLRDIHMALIKYGIWGFHAAMSSMAAALVEPCEHANMDIFLSDSEAGTQFKLLTYSNDRYRKHIEVVLPWLYRRGVFDE